MAQKLSPADLKKILHPTEFSRFLLTLVVMIPLIVGFIALLILTNGGAIVVILIALASFWFAVQIYVARMMGDMVLVTPNSFPEAYKAINDARTVFGVRKKVDAFVLEAGTYNLVMLPLLKRKFLLLNSEVLEAEQNGELRFLVGRFVGALSAKHHRLQWFSTVLSIAEAPMIFNILLMPYERAVQLSGDRLGLYFVDGNLAAGVHALFRLTVGQQLAERVDVGDFVAQEKRTAGSFFRFLARMLSPMPPMTKRVGHLIYFGVDRYPTPASQYVGTMSSGSRAAMKENYQAVKKKIRQ